jgi:hypothetical protein
MEMNNNSLLWFFAILFLAGGNGNFFGNRGPGPMGPPPATQQDVNEAINNQTVQGQLSDLRVATADNNLETVKAIAEQNAFMQNQQNANMINVIQGFNNLSQRIDQLGFKMESCCCELKTQMLQQQLDQARANEVRLQNKLDNRDQTQTLLSTMGRWIAWAGSGAQAGAVAATG